MSVKTIAVLFSGRGSNLKAICEYANKTNAYKVTLCITNLKDAQGIAIAKAYNVPVVIIEHANFSTREEFDAELVKCLLDAKVDLVVLAGFMRILTKVFIAQVKAINIHPSLLPLFRGANAIQESFNSQLSEGGITIHWVSEGVDEGEIIAKQSVPKNQDDTFEDFRDKIHLAEWELYPKTIDQILQGMTNALIKN